MYKVMIDPITRRILCYTKVMKNTPVYSTDILIEDEKLTEIPATELVRLTEEGEVQIETEDCYEEIQGMNAEYANIMRETESECLTRLLVDEGKDINESREYIQQRREKIKNLKKKIEEKQKEHERHIREYYMNEDRRKDELLDCQYYSAVIMVIKHENRYLKEWLDWHLSLGFQHIYLYDNGTEEHVTDVITEYPKEVQDKITIIDWSGHHTHLQQDAYNHFLDNYRQNVRWGIFIDSDEFVRFTDGKTEDVNDFLRKYEDYTEIWGHEIEYNANGKEHYEDKPVRERFTQLTDVREGFYWKNFIQSNRIDRFLMHYADYDKDKKFVFKNEKKNKDIFVIEHYYTKSWEEWCWKIKQRGGADPNYHKALQEFFVYNPDMGYLDTGENAVQAYEEN